MERRAKGRIYMAAQTCLQSLVRVSSYCKVGKGIFWERDIPGPMIVPIDQTNGITAYARAIIC